MYKNCCESNVVKKSKLKRHCLTADNWFGNYYGMLKAWKTGNYQNTTWRKNVAMNPYDELKKKKGKNLQDRDYKIMINEENPIVCVGIRSNSKFFTMCSSLPIDWRETVEIEVEKRKSICKCYFRRRNR